jgi:hypothetical protein
MVEEIQCSELEIMENENRFQKMGSRQQNAENVR